MYSKQYYITKSLTNPFDFLRGNIGKLNVFYNDELEFFNAKKGRKELVLLGKMFDPFAPKKLPEEILSEIISIKGLIEILKHLQGFSGRWVLVIKDDEEYYVLNDSFAQRQVYYSEKKILLSSSLKIISELETDLEITQEKEKLLTNPVFARKEYTWLGTSTIFNGISKLLPNHYLNVFTKETTRIPFDIEKFKELDLTIFIEQILKSTINYLTNNYEVHFPITAGWDSRLILAASKDFINKINFYTFGEDNDTNEDVKISKAFSKKNKLNHQIFQKKPLVEEFLEKYKEMNYFPRIMKKTSIIQHHYFNNYHNSVNINGNGGEVFRCFYGNDESYTIPINKLIVLAGYNKKFNLFKDDLHEWLQETNKVSKLYKIPILDLFYWEQKMGNWAASASTELDIAMEEISPFNNRDLLLAFLSVNRKDRIYPNFKFIREVINNMWSEVLEFPFNADENKLVNFIKRNTRLRYFMLVAKNILNK